MLWLILGAVHTVVWPFLSVLLFNAVDLRYYAFALLFTVPLVQAIILASVTARPSRIAIGGGRDFWLLGIDALLLAALLLGLAPKAVAIAVLLKALILGAQRRFVLAIAAGVVGIHIAFNLSDVLSAWMHLGSNAVRWGIAFGVLNVALLAVLFRDRSTGGAPLLAMLGFAVVMCNFFLHPYLAGPWAAIAPTLYSAAFSFAIAGQRAGAEGAPVEQAGATA